MDKREVLGKLKTEAARAGSVRRYALAMGLPQQTVSAALNGTRPIPKALLQSLGLHRVVAVTYEKTARRALPAATKAGRAPQPAADRARTNTALVDAALGAAFTVKFGR